MLNNNHSSDCSFSAEIPAYLYGEISKGEKSKFEGHLVNCSNCADALADSAFARFSVQEWRDTEFAHLETPLINIPYERNKANITVSDSWLACLRQYVSLSPAWATAGGAMAALAIGVGLVFAAINIFQPAEISVVNNYNSAKIAVSPTTELAAQKPENFPEQSPELPTKNVEVKQLDFGRRNKQASEPKNNKLITSNNASQNKIVKRNTEKISTNNRVTAGMVNKPIASKTRQVPALVNFEEEEDDTLRLAELFDKTETEK